MFAQFMQTFPAVDSFSLMLTLVLVLTIYYFIKPKRNYPPGPTGLPFFGSLFQLISAFQTDALPYLVDSWIQKYGSIVFIETGFVKMIYLMNVQDIKELFSREDVSYRPKVEAVKMLFKDQKETGVMFNSNLDSHKEMRRHVLLSLRDFGVGKSSLDEIIQDEAEAFTQYLDSLIAEEGGISEDIKPKVQMCVANVIHNICFGYRYDYSDEKYHSLLQQLDEFFHVNPASFLENFLPLVRYIPFINTRKSIKDFFDIQDSNEKYIEQQIEEHRKRFDSNEVRDFVDLYLKNEQDGLSEEFKKHCDQRGLYFVILDLFRAGTDTTANTMTWSVLHLMKNPDIQKELHEEIDREIGDQPFKRSEKEKLKKVRAFINEIFRHVSIAYEGIPHSTIDDIQFRGYMIPTNAMIIPAIRSIHYDKTYWNNPEVFDIDRWFDADGKELSHESHFLPFGIGRRVCIGKQLAQIELVVFLVAILQKFRFEAVQPQDEIDERPHFGIAAQAKPFKFKIIRRLQQE